MAGRDFPKCLLRLHASKVAFREVYRDYEATTQRRSEIALDPEQFTASLAKLCQGTSVYACESQGSVYLINVRFAGVKAKAPRSKKA